MGYRRTQDLAAVFAMAGRAMSRVQFYYLLNLGEAWRGLPFPASGGHGRRENPGRGRGPNGGCGRSGRDPLPNDLQRNVGRRGAA